MLLKTKAVVLKTVKYGETSLIATLFTEAAGVQAYMVQGVRSSSQARNRAGMFQPGSLLDLVVYEQPDKNLKRIKEYHQAHIYTSLQEQVVKNCILLFSVELLYRLLPPHAEMPSLFDFCFDYFILLDQAPIAQAANFPLYFIVQCSRELGYEISGTYTDATPHLNLKEGGFTADTPESASITTHADAEMLNQLLTIDNWHLHHTVAMSSAMRFRLIDWFIAFLQQHTQHMGNIRSLQVLQAVLH